MQQAVFVIKPEAFSQREAIREFILANSNLKIIDSHVDVLTSADVESLYVHDAGTPLMEAAKTHLLNHPVEVCLVEGENAPIELMKVAGEHFDPKECAPNTVRARFGSTILRQYGEVTYYMNAIHRTDSLEAPAAVEWFHSKY